MSPHAVNNFVSDLVAMAQAMERVPQLERDLEQSHRMMQEQGNVIVSMQADLAQSRDYASTLEQKVHDLEVAKDQAETMFLEADERTSRALDFVKALFGNAGALIQALEPPKAAAPQADSPKVDTTLSEPHLFGDHGGGIGQPLSGSSVSHEPVAAQLDSIAGDKRDVPLSASTEVPHTAGATSPSVSSLDDASSTGQREPDPTATAMDGASAIASIPNAESNTVADTTKPSEQPGPYHGKYYIDVPNFCTFSEWLAGGGTEFDYHYRHHSANRY